MVQKFGKLYRWRFRRILDGLPRNSGNFSHFDDSSSPPTRKFVRNWSKVWRSFSTSGKPVRPHPLVFYLPAFGWFLVHSGMLKYQPAIDLHRRWDRDSACKANLLRVQKWISFRFRWAENRLFPWMCLFGDFLRIVCTMARSSSKKTIFSGNMMCSFFPSIFHGQFHQASSIVIGPWYRPKEKG